MAKIVRIQWFYTSSYRYMIHCIRGSQPSEPFYASSLLQITGKAFAPRTIISQLVVQVCISRTWLEQQSTESSLTCPLNSAKHFDLSQRFSIKLNILPIWDPHVLVYITDIYFVPATDLKQGKPGITSFHLHNHVNLALQFDEFSLKLYEFKLGKTLRNCDFFGD